MIEIMYMLYTDFVCKFCFKIISKINDESKNK